MLGRPFAALVWGDQLVRAELYFGQLAVWPSWDCEWRHSCI